MKLSKEYQIKIKYHDNLVDNTRYNGLEESL